MKKNYFSGTKTLVIASILLMNLVPCIIRAAENAPSSLNLPRGFTGAQDALKKAANEAGFSVTGDPEKRIFELTGAVIKIFLSVVGTIFFLLMIYGGWIWLIARGDEKKVDKAKDAIQAAIIGLVIVLVASSVSQFVTDRLGVRQKELKDVSTAAGYQQVAFATQIAGIVQLFLSVVGVVFFLLIIYGGYNWLIARGDEKRVDKAKEIIFAAVIGLFIVLAAYAISFFIVSRLSQSAIAV